MARRKLRTALTYVEWAWYRATTKRGAQVAAWLLLALALILACVVAQPTATPASDRASVPATSSAPPVVTAPSCTPGDDNCDGVMDEDESGWRCDTDGNAYCGDVTYLEWRADCLTRFEFGPKRQLCQDIGYDLASKGAIKWHH